jgi:hypothetical protein
MDHLVCLLRDVNAPLGVIQKLLCEILITPEGSVNWEAKDELESYGFWVYPVERDSFGWVVGAVETDRGVITFG